MVVLDRRVLTPPIQSIAMSLRHARGAESF
jgi:hypothetical protein